MTDSDQDVKLDVVTPLLPATLVCPIPGSLAHVRTHDSTEKAFRVADQPSSTVCTAPFASYAGASCGESPQQSDQNYTVSTLSSVRNKQSDAQTVIHSRGDYEAQGIFIDTPHSLYTDKETLTLDGQDRNETIATEGDDLNTNGSSNADSPPRPRGKSLINFPPIQDSEENLSVSTDETIHNSDSDSSAFVYRRNSPLELTERRVKSTFDSDTSSSRLSFTNMGNQQNKESIQSDEDTPDETKTKCCEIPKKKVKDRYNKVTSRTSKTGEDCDFDADELYPFDSRTRSENEIVDPVELEPFEIIETDDIKFIPGAGTSDVIKRASQATFKAIPEEDGGDDEDKFDTFIIKHDKPGKQERPQDKELVVINKGGVFIEPGTSTTHSTFEFKPAKAKQKAQSKTKDLTNEPTYENLQAVSGCSSKTGSTSSSNDASRKNSKDGIQKPVRQKSKKGKESSASDQKNKEKIEKSTKTKSKLTEETNDNQAGNKAFILTQTMFSVPNPNEKSAEKPKLMNESNMPQNAYENVNVGVKLGPSGITICNTTPETGTDKECLSCNTSNSKQIIEEMDEADTSLNPQGASASPLYETLTSELKDKIKTGINESEETKCKTSSKSPTDQAIETPSATRISEHVPPPSPLALEILEEEEEEEEEEEDDFIDDEPTEEELIEEANKRKSEILEFTETVCKRLSQLLEDQPSIQADNIQDTNEHIYETMQKEEALYAELIPKDIEINVNDKHEPFSTECILRPPVREDSSSTLKRTSGDSGTYQEAQNQGSSDDDLPDYFDPKSAQQQHIPKRDSEILCDVLDAYTEEGITAVSARDIADIVGSHTLEFGDDIESHSTSKAEKHMALPLQSFDDSLINKAPQTSSADEIQDRTPIAEIQSELTALQELADAKVDVPVQYDNSGRQSVTYTESDLDISEHRDDLSTDSMLADDEDEETMEILFTKTYTEPVDGGEVFLSCTVVNSAYKDEHKKSDTWLSDEAIEFFEANAADVMSTAFMKARKEMKDIQVCLQSLRKQMEHFHDDVDDISLPDIPVDALSPSDYFGLPRKAVTD